MKLNGEEGYVLVLGIIILGALIILIFSISNMIGMDLSFYRNNRDSNRAFYAAESGIAYGESVVFNNTYWDTNELTTPSAISLEEATVTKVVKAYDIIGGESLVILESFGKSNKKDSHITAKYKINIDEFNTSIATLGDINFGNVTNIYGNEIGGDIYAEGSIYDKQGDLIIDGSETNQITLHDSQIVDSAELPNITFEYLYNYAKTNESNSNVLILPDSSAQDYSDLGDPSANTYILDDLESVYDSIDNKFTFINGNLEIDNNTEIIGNGILVINGYLKIKNQLNINQGDENSDKYFSVFVKGEESSTAIVTEGNNQINIQGYIYTEGAIDIKNTFDLDGALVSTGDVNLSNSPTINFENGFISNFIGNWGINFPDIDDDDGNSLKIVSWQEQ